MISIAIHGGATNAGFDSLGPNKGRDHLLGLNSIIDAAYNILDSGGSSLDAVTAAVVMLEDYEVFNAAKGSMLNTDGHVEMDASIMDGFSLKTGAVCNVRHIKNPILTAKHIMENTGQNMFSGNAAEEIALTAGLPLMPNDYFITDFRKEQLRIHKEKLLKGVKVELENAGTVGAVAIDSKGNLAAATSTGGPYDKPVGRIGDSAIIGCGTYANNESIAISCTGKANAFFSHVVAYDVHALVKYKGMSLAEATKHVFKEKFAKNHDIGGCVAVDINGEIVMEFNTNIMFRAMRSSGGKRFLSIF